MKGRGEKEKEKGEGGAMLDMLPRQEKGEREAR